MHVPAGDSVTPRQPLPSTRLNWLPPGAGTFVMVALAPVLFVTTMTLSTGDPNGTASKEPELAVSDSLRRRQDHHQTGRK